MYGALTCAALSVAARVDAQVPTPVVVQGRTAADSLLKARADSIAHADSASGALAQAEVPVLTEVGMSHRWNRDSLFSSGALTLADFLDRVPGLATLRARFYMAPQVGAYNGDVARVRLFLDGIELEALDTRSGGIADLSQFPLAALDELVIERGANELRLLMRSWRGPQLTTAQTRADVYTGDNRSNTFRGFLARRARNGFAMQVMLQQRSTDDRLLGGDGDATAILARVGIIKPNWSLDANMLRVRSTQQTLTLVNNAIFSDVGRPIPAYSQVQRELYLRFAAGDVSRGPWLQVIAAQRQHVENTPQRASDLGSGFAADSADSTRTSTQYIASVGWSSPHTRVSVTERLRRQDGLTLHQPSARIGFDLGRVSISAFGERNPFDKVTRADAAVRLQPVPWFAVTGAASYGTTGSQSLPVDSTNTRELVFLPVARAARGEVALRLGHLWFQGGGVFRDSAVLRAPAIFDRTTPVTIEGRVSGATFTVVGPLFKGFSVHVNGVRWQNAGVYRPQTEVRSELTWRYHWIGATKTGFTFLLAGTAEYRTPSFVPVLVSTGVATLATYQATPLGVRAEFTIKDATISVQSRNILNVPYSTVPGLLSSGPITIYGVRWTFWN
jgi:hypothetical protein